MGAGETSRTFLMRTAGTHLGLRANALPFAGGRGTGDLDGARRARDRESQLPGACVAVDELPLIDGRARDDEVRDRGEEGIRRDELRTFARSDRSARDVSASSEDRRHARLDAHALRREAGFAGRTRTRDVLRLCAVRGTTCSLLVPVRRLRVAEVDRPSSGPEKRDRDIDRVESSIDPTRARERGPSRDRDHAAQAS